MTGIVFSTNSTVDALLGQMDVHTGSSKEVKQSTLDLLTIGSDVRSDGVDAVKGEVIYEAKLLSGEKKTGWVVLGRLAEKLGIHSDFLQSKVQSYENAKSAQNNGAQWDSLKGLIENQIHASKGNPDIQSVLPKICKHAFNSTELPKGAATLGQLADLNLAMKTHLNPANSGAAPSAGNHTIYSPDVKQIVENSQSKWGQELAQIETDVKAALSSYATNTGSKPLDYSTVMAGIKDKVWGDSTLDLTTFKPKDAQLEQFRQEASQFIKLGDIKPLDEIAQRIEENQYTRTDDLGPRTGETGLNKNLDDQLARHAARSAEGKSTAATTPDRSTQAQIDAALLGRQPN